MMVRPKSFYYFDMFFKKKIHKLDHIGKLQCHSKHAFFQLLYLLQDALHDPSGVVYSAIFRVR